MDRPGFPGLWGYVGIDLIKRNEELLIVEIMGLNEFLCWH